MARPVRQPPTGPSSRERRPAGTTTSYAIAGSQVRKIRFRRRLRWLSLPVAPSNPRRRGRSIFVEIAHRPDHDWNRDPRRSQRRAAKSVCHIATLRCVHFRLTTPASSWGAAGEPGPGGARRRRAIKSRCRCRILARWQIWIPGPAAQSRNDGVVDPRSGQVLLMPVPGPGTLRIVPSRMPDHNTPLRILRSGPGFLDHDLARDEVMI
jgi:hypothetical protein